MVTEAMLNELPLSEQLRVAVADARRALRDPRMKLDMHEWLTWSNTGKCRVCLAGAVLYYRRNQREELGSGTYACDLPEFALNINNMRTGQLPIIREWPGLTETVRQQFLEHRQAHVQHSRE